MLISTIKVLTNKNVHVLAFLQVRMVVCLNPNAEDYDESVVRCQILIYMVVFRLYYKTSRYLK